MNFNFSAINLGCNKNLVDLEFTLGAVFANREVAPNYFTDPEDEDVEYVIINTCSFLSTSRQEAQETITYYDNLWKKIIITGCYVQLADSDFLAWLKNLYRIIPFEKLDNVEEELFNNSKIQEFREKKLDSYLQGIYQNQIWKKAFIWKWNEVRAYMNADSWYEYLKIAEWCDNSCTFCIIPSIRGNQKSRQIKDIVNEAVAMINSGIKEIIIIAQDTTRYGVDNYWEPKLIELSRQINSIDADFKFRLLYMYPDNLSLDNLWQLQKLDKFIPYFDIPFQHISPTILKKMWRYYNEEWIFSFLDYIKINFKNYHLRTSFIIGFPWEKDTDFDLLCDFVKKYEFDSVALFEYHDEPLAASSKILPKVPDKTIKSRMKKLDKIINEIYDKKYRKDIWKKFIWFVVDYDKKNIWIRREIRAPEIDELDIISSKWFKDVELGDRVEYRL